MAGLELSNSVFAILSALVSERVGLHYGLMDRDLLCDKASGRALDAGFESLLDYYYFLRYDPAGEQELTALVEVLVVNETYLFREWDSIRTLVDSFIVPWCAQGRRPRIWSAACSTGEEPLSLAMLLDHKGLLDRVEIVASDISVNALAKARSGRFGRRAVRHVPDVNLLERYVTKESESFADGYAIDQRLVKKIAWHQKNLLNAADLKSLGSFDAILCRNVLIYFADSTVKSVIHNLSENLVSDGVLLIGVSESLLRYGTNFSGEEHGGCFMYRKFSK